jgi:PPOX class probable F420-dependent enzyme
MSELTMSKATREAFLADVHVGVFCVNRDDDAPLATPVWYLYEPGGDVQVIVGASSQKAALVKAAGRASLCAQQEGLPYRFVTVEGRATFEEVDRDLRFKTASRYLGDELAKAYIEQTDDRDSVLVRITPERWRTNDYSNWNAGG